MAIVQMQRINICALKKNRKAILERLQELGAMEVDIRLEDEELCEKQDVSRFRPMEGTAETVRKYLRDPEYLFFLGNTDPKKNTPILPSPAIRPKEYVQI